MSEIIYADESYAIMGACFHVYNAKGCGFLELVYQECMEIELEHQGIDFVSQPELRMTYRGRELNQTYRPDLICFDKIVIELKAVSHISAEHRAQLFNYLRAGEFRLGLLVNFGHYPKLEYERIVVGRDSQNVEF